MKDKFNMLNTKLQTTSSKNKIASEEESKVEIENTFERKKRKFDELESVFTCNPLQNRHSTISTSKLILKPIESVSNLPYEKKESIHTTIASDNTKLQAIETLEKYLTMDERYIEFDKNIGSCLQSKIKIN
jgi:hypothetical protein